MRSGLAIEIEFDRSSAGPGVGRKIASTRSSYLLPLGGLFDAQDQSMQRVILAPRLIELEHQDRASEVP